METKKPLVVVLKADSHYDGIELLKTQLFQARMDITAEGFNIESLGKSFYLINFPNPTFNYKHILRQFGAVMDVSNYLKREGGLVDRIKKEVLEDPEIKKILGKIERAKGLLTPEYDVGGVWEQEDMLDDMLDEYLKTEYLKTTSNEKD